MRSDMFKVIVERPRRGVGYFRTLHNDYRAAKRFKLDEDLEVCDEFCGTKLPMKAKRLGWDGKQLNENLNPLRRFIEKRVGRLWDDVYSEICEFINVNSTVQQHVRDHVDDYVYTKTYRGTDGCVYACTSSGIQIINGFNGFSWRNRKDLYVEPETGLLRDDVDYEFKDIYIRPLKITRTVYENGKFVVKDVNKIAPPNPKKAVGNLRFEKIEGIWFCIELGLIESRAIYHERHPVLREDYPNDQAFQIALLRRTRAYDQKVRDAKREWNSPDPVEMIGKRTASKKEIKKYGLREVV